MLYKIGDWKIENMDYDVIRKIVMEIGLRNNKVIVDKNITQILLDEMISDPDYGKKISDGALVGYAWKE